MNNYDLNIFLGRAIVRVYLQFETYKGYYDTTIRGNIKGKSILESVLDNVEDLEQEDILDTDCELKIKENDTDASFSCVLNDENENTLEFDDTLDELEDIIVGCQIIKFEPYERERNLI